MSRIGINVPKDSISNNEPISTKNNNKYNCLRTLLGNNNKKNFIILITF